MSCIVHTPQTRCERDRLDVRDRATHENDTSDQSRFSRMSRESRAKNEMRFMSHASRVLRTLLENRVGERLTNKCVGNLFPRHRIRTGVYRSANSLDTLFSCGIWLIG